MIRKKWDRCWNISLLLHRLVVFRHPHTHTHHVSQVPQQFKHIFFWMYSSKLHMIINRVVALRQQKKTLYGSAQNLIESYQAFTEYIRWWKAGIFHRDHFPSDWNGLVPLSKRLQIDTGGNEADEGRKMTFKCLYIMRCLFGFGWRSKCLEKIHVAYKKMGEKKTEYASKSQSGM